jgi:hypothetical protein
MTDYNQHVPLKYRTRLNMQKNICKLEGIVRDDGFIIQPYRYVVGLGEKHFKEMDDEILRIIDTFPWLRKRHARLILNEIILNSQFSSLRRLLERIPNKKKTAGFLTLTLHVNHDFLSSSLEEYGDYFNYFEYITSKAEAQDDCDEVQKNETSPKKEFSNNKLKLILTETNELRVPDESNQIALKIIENATDHDFYITSFYKMKTYMWKRIYFRLDR